MSVARLCCFQRCFCGRETLLARTPLHISRTSPSVQRYFRPSIYTHSYPACFDGRKTYGGTEHPGMPPSGCFLCELFLGILQLLSLSIGSAVTCSLNGTRRRRIMAHGEVARLPQPRLRCNVAGLGGARCLQPLLGTETTTPGARSARSSGHTHADARTLQKAYYTVDV